MQPTRRSAFVELFDAHYRQVLGYLSRRLNEPTDAEEIAAEVFRLAWLKQDPAAPLGRAWLFKVASNRLTDHYRRQGVRAEAESALRRRLEDAPGRLGLEDELDLRAALEGLTSREREVLQLTYWEGLSAAEVGDALGCSTGSVWAMLSRTRAKLHATLEPSTQSGASR